MLSFIGAGIIILSAIWVAVSVLSASASPAFTGKSKRSELVPSQSRNVTHPRDGKHSADAVPIAALTPWQLDKPREEPSTATDEETLPFSRTPSPIPPPGQSTRRGELYSYASVPTMEVGSPDDIDGKFARGTEDHEESSAPVATGDGDGASASAHAQARPSASRTASGNGVTTMTRDGRLGVVGNSRPSSRRSSAASASAS